MSEQPHVDRTARLSLIAVFILGIAFFLYTREEAKREDMLIEYISNQLNLSINTHQKLKDLEKDLAARKASSKPIIGSASATTNPTAQAVSAQAQ